MRRVSITTTDVNGAMMTLKTVIGDANARLAVDPDTLAEAIEAFGRCAAACTACSSACLAESEVADLRDCIATNDVCAEVCTATANVAARLTKGSYAILRSQLEACDVACRICREECERHAQEHPHCAACAEACADAQSAASRLLEAVPS